MLGCLFCYKILFNFYMYVYHALHVVFWILLVKKDRFHSLYTNPPENCEDLWRLSQSATRKSVSEVALLTESEEVHVPRIDLPSKNKLQRKPLTRSWVFFYDASGILHFEQSSYHVVIINKAVKELH